MPHMRTHTAGEQGLPSPKLGKAGTVTRNARIIRGNPKIAKPTVSKKGTTTSTFSFAKWKPGSEGPGPTWDWRARQQEENDKGEEEKKDKNKKKKKK